jgi:putative toxin-antitoxin system antitoxin component (TIGR02293 family)
MAKTVAGGVLAPPAVRKAEAAKTFSGPAKAARAEHRRAAVGVSQVRAQGIADARGEYPLKPVLRPVLKPAKKIGEKGSEKIGGKSAGSALALDAVVGVGLRDAAREPVTLFDRMGRLLDQPLRSESDIVRMVDAGLPPAAFTALTRRLAIGHDLIAPESTVRRRLQDNQRFTTDESERMVRIARVHALAVELFGEETAAQAWLNAPAQYVPGAAAVSPYRLSVTDAGARLVEDMLLRTAHGVF